MTVRIALSTRNAILDAVAAQIDAGSGAGTIAIYTGAQPANADAAATGTLLVTFTLADPAFAAATGSTLTLDADPDLVAAAVATGTAGWARVRDSDNNTVFDGSVGTSGSGQDFTLTTTSIVSGQNVTLSAGALSFPTI